jgi:hypothetical protein
VKKGFDIPFNEYRIHIRNPLSVNASGMMNIRSTNADVASSSSSTIPTAYSTDGDGYYTSIVIKKPSLPPKTKCSPARI